MYVALLQQSSADLLTYTALKEDVVGHDDRRPSLDRQQRGDVLNEVEQLVRGRLPEVGSSVCHP